jgi:hypothetical protein
MVICHDFYFEYPGVLAMKVAVLTEVSHIFPQSCQEIPGY